MALAAVSISPGESSHYNYIVVGSGPVGLHFIQELLKQNNSTNIAVFGDEPWTPYNRVQLSSLISGEVKEPSLYNPFDLNKISNVTPFYNNRITAIDRKHKQVIDSFGNHYHYSKLVLATGSRPNIPDIKGNTLKNIYTFRDLSDAQSLMGRSVRTRRTIIIGGGLLGLEAARAMQRFNTEVHIIEHSSWLMFNQLNDRAGSYLKHYIESLGIHIHVNQRVKEIKGDNKVEAVQLTNDESIECDTVIFAAGIIVNNELAVDAGIAISRGIRVDDHLQTNDTDIYAIGECAEHNCKMYGLVAPGFEQASVLARHLSNDSKIKYRGSVAATNLKVLDYPVFSIGNTGISARERECFIFQDHEHNIYRKIVVINGRIRGAIGIGEWPAAQRVQEAVEHKRRIWPWQLKRFTTDGILWYDSDTDNIAEWPSTAIVCNCTGVTRGQLSDAFKQGACSAAKLATETGASTICGSCKPLLADFVGGTANAQPTQGYITLLIASIITLLAAISALLLPSIDYSDSVHSTFNIDALWRENLYKQISGFSILGLSVFISFISIRKRVKKFSQSGNYAYWRMMHIVIGVVAVAGLLAHTGFRMGNNLNFALMLTYSSLLLAGSIAGIVIAYEHAISRYLAKRLRSYAVWSHILLLWPLPALLGFHIFKTYYF